MKIEVGQWVRWNTNNFYKASRGLHTKFSLLVGTKYVDLRGVEINKIIKVANTPQELIQVGDLVYDGYYLTEVQIMFLEINQLAIPYNSLRFEDITKIYTPNEDKSQYTLQWSIEV